MIGVMVILGLVALGIQSCGLLPYSCEVRMTETLAEPVLAT
jgi:hypothetical protein